MTLLHGLGLTVLLLSVVASLDGYLRTVSPGWQARDIEPIGSWRTVRGAQVVLALACGGVVAAHVGAWEAVTVTALVWLAVLAVFTDLGSYRIPWDACWAATVPAALAAIPGIWLTPSKTAALLSAGTALFFLVAIPLGVSLLLGRALGMSDIRLLLVVVVATGWWADPTLLIYGLMGASIPQLVARMLAPRLGWGRMVAAPSGASRREMPFAPAIVASMALAIGVSVATEATACQTWAPGTVCTET